MTYMDANHGWHPRKPFVDGIHACRPWIESVTITFVDEIGVRHDAIHGLHPWLPSMDTKTAGGPVVGGG